MTESDRQLIYDLWQLQITDAVFHDNYSMKFVDKQQHVIDLLNECIVTKSAEDLESTLLLARLFKVNDKKLIPLLNIILPQDWHYKHEDIVSDFEKFKSVDTIDSLYETALKKYDYLDYDDFNGLARRCTWALAKINTKESFEKLKLLSNVDNELISSYAKKRLEK